MDSTSTTQQQQQPSHPIGKRFQLSQLINKVLQLTQPVPFDFVVNDQLLRTSVKNFIDSHGLSTESVLEIEYLESVLPPKFIQRPSQIASGGLDRVIKIWEISSSDSTPLKPESIYSYKNTHVLPLHKSPVSTIQSSNNNQLLTGDWEGILALWDLSSSVGDHQIQAENAEFSDQDPRNLKRRKRNKNLESSTVISKEPIQVIHAHQSKISRAIFSKTDKNKVYTTSHDHTVKRSSFGTHKATQNISLILHGHSGPVSTVSTNPSQMNSLQILSGSYDGTCKIWDTRSTKQSLYTIQNPAHSSIKSLNPNQKLPNCKIWLLAELRW
ncbi:hypothetical protein H4Q26_004749 [Puccinia striiformis f. sp. tritici PST-130]|nr:hypothetical protein H4Q26_004749 [Puccinia striiformis f. sp. tritici PST-130]